MVGFLKSLFVVAHVLRFFGIAVSLLIKVQVRRVPTCMYVVCKRGTRVKKARMSSASQWGFAVICSLCGSVI